MQENEPVEKKRNTTFSPPRGGRRRKILRRSFEERLKAVKLQLEEGFTQELIAQEMGISLAAVAKWVHLYRLHGEEGLKDKGNGGPRPRLAEPVRSKILELKKEEPTRGIKRISQLLKRVFFLQASAETVRKTLKEQGLIESPPKPRRNLVRPRFFERATPNQMWQTDIFTFRLGGRYAYCLMSTHFHLVVETPQPNLVPGMKWLLGTYTSRSNRRHREFGHLFSGRYKALIVDGSGNGYLKSVCDYVHLNPVRAKLLRAEEPLESYAWSSYGQYLKPPGKRSGWLRVDRLLGEWGIPKDSPAGRKRFAQCLEHRRREESPKSDWSAVERGWFLGDKVFKEELLAQMCQRRGDHYGPELREADLVHAERLVKDQLRKRHWTEAELSRRRKGDPEKVQMASELRAQTTMTLKWIAQRLDMGAWTHVSNCLVQKRKKEKQCQ